MIYFELPQALSFEIRPISAIWMLPLSSDTLSDGKKENPSRSIRHFKPRFPSKTQYGDAQCKQLDSYIKNIGKQISNASCRATIKFPHKFWPSYKMKITFDDGMRL